MKPIIFVRIADMKYYRGNTQHDTPFNGGSYVKENRDAHECYNFEPIIQDGPSYEKCIGFFMLSAGNGASQLHIEKIVGCEFMKGEEKIENVHVVFVSKAPDSKTMRVVGFYKDAVVYRHLQYMEDYDQFYWFEAAKENCVLLPYTERHCGNKWFVPASSSKYQEYGFGRANVWFAAGNGASEKEIEYTERMIRSIDTYQGENWMDKEVQQ